MREPPDPLDVAGLLCDLQHEAFRLSAASQQRRGLKAGRAAKRRVVNRLFRLLFGRPATEVEHGVAATDAVGFYR